MTDNTPVPAKRRKRPVRLPPESRLDAGREYHHANTKRQRERVLQKYNISRSLAAQLAAEYRQYAAAVQEDESVDVPPNSLMQVLSLVRDGVMQLDEACHVIKRIFRNVHSNEK